MSRRFEVQAIPTLVLMHHGQVVATQTGAAPVSTLRSWLTEHLPQPDATGADAPWTGEDRR